MNSPPGKYINPCLVHMPLRLIMLVSHSVYMALRVMLLETFIPHINYFQRPKRGSVRFS